MQFILLLIFILGYTAIAFEHQIKINKTASALLTGVLCWTVYIIGTRDTIGSHSITENLMEHLGNMSGILFPFWER